MLAPLAWASVQKVAFLQHLNGHTQPRLILHQFMLDNLFANYLWLQKITQTSG
jgi:hypothetical protein